jgi:hypothetical protein
MAVPQHSNEVVDLVGLFYWVAVPWRGLGDVPISAHDTWKRLIAERGTLDT